MKLSQYLRGFLPSERADFALAVGTTIGHLNNVVYGTRVASAALAKQIAIKTRRTVAEWDLRPDDWHLIWPELVNEPGAPGGPATTAPAAQQQEARDAA